MRPHGAAAATALLLLLSCVTQAHGGYLLPPEDIPLNGTEGTRLLANASHAAPFYQLINHFVTQASPARGVILPGNAPLTRVFLIRRTKRSAASRPR
jgi:hypothetical protein